MALPRKLTERIYEIKAHSGNVTCLDVGETGRVLVTGGQDRNVNLWAIGQTECFMSLTGHNRPIDCVRFAYNDDFVYSADDIGIIRRWDLNAQTICSTLNGHMKSVRTLDFNPSGEYVVSGSNDTTVRLWDVRNQNACMKVYRGHVSHVNSVKFSPDGLWISSAGAEGSVIIWDIRKSKQIMEFCQQQQIKSQQKQQPQQSIPNASITCIRFHPFEFLLAVGRMDGIICIYDLETQLLLTQTGASSLFYGSSIKCITFGENGECLFVGTASGISVIGWEPDREFDHIKSAWTALGDMKIVNRRLICGSYDREYVAIDALSVNRVFPFHNPSNIPSTFVHNATARKSFSRGTQKLRLTIGGPRQSRLIEENEGNSSPNIDEHSSPNLSLELVDENATIVNTNNVMQSIISPTLSTNNDGDDTLTNNYSSSIGGVESLVGDFTSTYSSLGINIPIKKNSPPSSTSPSTQSASHHFLAESCSLSGNRFDFHGPSSLKMPGELYSDIYQYDSDLCHYDDDFKSKTNISYNESFAPIISNYDHNEMVEDFPVNTNLHQSPPPSSSTNSTSQTGNVGTSTTTNHQHHQTHHNHHHHTRNTKVKTTTHTNKRTSVHVTTSTKSIHGNSTHQQRPKLSQISSISTTDLHKMDDNSLLKKSASSHVVVHKTKAYLNKEKENARNKNSMNVQIITKPPTRSRTSLELRLPSKDQQQSGTDQRQLQTPQTHIPISYRPDPSLLTSSSMKNLKTRPNFGEITEIEILSSTHEQIYQELSTRHATLQLIRDSTRSHDVMGAFKKAIQMGRTVFVDFLGAILEKTSSWNLDLCMLLLPEIYELLQSQHKFHYTRACDTLRVILYNFLPIIQDNLDPWINGLGVDVTREERHRKCLECQRWLLQIRNLPESNHFASTTLTQLQNLIVNI